MARRSLSSLPTCNLLSRFNCFQALPFFLSEMTKPVAIDTPSRIPCDRTHSSDELSFSQSSYTVEACGEKPPLQSKPTKPLSNIRPKMHQSLLTQSHPQQTYSSMLSRLLNDQSPLDRRLMQRRMIKHSQTNILNTQMSSQSSNCSDDSDMSWMSWRSSSSSGLSPETRRQYFNVAPQCW